MKTTLSLILVLFAVANLGYSLPKEERDTFGTIASQFENNLRETLKSYGLGEKNQDKLIKEFTEILKNIPIPPLSPWDLMRPAKIYAYVQEVTAFVQDVYNRIMANAAEMLKDELKGRLGQRDINFSIKLPGGQILLNTDFGAIEKYLREKFESLGLKAEDRERLLKQYEEFLKGLPKLRPLELLNPLKVLRFVEFVTVKVGEFVVNVLYEAEQLVKGILLKDARSVRLPGLADFVDHMRELIEKELESLTGLKGEQRRQLIKEFLDQIRNFPNIKGWHTLKPSQITKYLKEVKEFADDVTKTIVEKAKAMIEKNKAEKAEGGETQKRSIVDIGQRLPGMRDLVEDLLKRLENALSSVSGLTDGQREELTKDFLDGIRNFANEKGITSLKPSQLKKFVEDIKEFADGVISIVLEKAKAVAAGAGNTHDKRAFPFQPPQFILALQAKLVRTFQTAIYALTGLTDEQQNGIIQEFKDGISKIPLPPIDRPWNIFNPLEWIKYISDLTNYNIELTKKLLEKAKAILKGEPLYPEKDRRALNVDAVLDELVLQFKNVLGSISGLNEEETEALIQEFRDQIDTYPTMPFADWFRPAKVFDYLKKLREFGLKLTSLFLEKAKAIVDHRLGQRAVDFRITFPDVTNDETPNFDPLLNLVKNYAAKLGLTEDEQNFLIARVKVELSKYPQRPSGVLNPLRWAQYLQERNTYIKNVVLKAMRDAEDYIAKKNA